MFKIDQKITLNDYLTSAIIKGITCTSSVYLWTISVRIIYSPKNERPLYRISEDHSQEQNNKVIKETGGITGILDSQTASQK